MTDNFDNREPGSDFSEMNSDINDSPIPPAEEENKNVSSFEAEKDEVKDFLGESYSDIYSSEKKSDDAVTEEHESNEQEKEHIIADDEAKNANKPQRPYNPYVQTPPQQYYASYPQYGDNRPPVNPYTYQHQYQQPPYQQNGATQSQYNAPYNNSQYSGGYGTPQYGAPHVPVTPHPDPNFSVSEGPSPYLADENRSDGDGGNKPPKKNKKGIVIISIVIALAVIAAIVGIVFALSDGSNNNKLPNNNNPSTSSNVPADNDDDNDENKPKLEISDDVSAESLSVAGIAAKLEASNVGVVIYTQTNEIYGQGSGIVMTEDGYIITCAHVISGAENYTVKVVFNDSSEYNAKIVGYDERSDVGVLKIENKTDCTPAEFGDSNELQVGEAVIAIGNPGGLSFFGSVTTGVVSAIDRPISSEIGYSMKCIQHSAAINPGNSGGLLANSKGQVIGINSSKISGTDYEGMAFSIPITDAKEIIDSIIQNGYVKDRAKLGISYVQATSNYYYNALISLHGLPEGTVVIASINSDSDLANYDVRQYDLIVSANGQELTEDGQLVEIINGLKPGDNITLGIVRIDTNNQQKTEFEVTCKVIEDTGSSVSSSQQQVPNGNGGGQSEIF